MNNAFYLWTLSPSTGRLQKLHQAAPVPRWWTHLRVRDLCLRPPVCLFGECHVCSSLESIIPTGKNSNGAKVKKKRKFNPFSNSVLALRFKLHLLLSILQELSTFTLEKAQDGGVRMETGKGKCPFEPSQHYAAVMAGGAPPSWPNPIFILCLHFTWASRRVILQMVPFTQPPPATSWERFLTSPGQRGQNRSASGPSNPSTGWTVTHMLPKHHA